MVGLNLHQLTPPTKWRKYRGHNSVTSFHRMYTDRQRRYTKRLGIRHRTLMAREAPLTTFSPLLSLNVKASMAPVTLAALKVNVNGV